MNNMSNKQNDIILENMQEIKETTPSKAMVSQQTNNSVSDYDIKSYIAKRTDFIKNVNTICIEGKDYHVIQGKKSLAKGGAEKIASIFKWTAKFDKDTEAIEMLGSVPGLVAFKCTLMNGQFVGEGRGAATMAKNAGDPNKTLKMAQKSAFIDAVLRSSGLSDFFTQDLEDMPPQTQSPHSEQNIASNSQVEAKPASDKQKGFILALIDKKGAKGIT